METIKDFLIACIFILSLFGIRLFIIDAVKDAISDFYTDKEIYDKKRKERG